MEEAMRLNGRRLLSHSELRDRTPKTLHREELAWRSSDQHTITRVGAVSEGGKRG